MHVCAKLHDKLLLHETVVVVIVYNVVAHVPMHYMIMIIRLMAHNSTTNYNYEWMTLDCTYKMYHGSMM